ncbi:helix-turn-helix domain-containing protein [Solidesulfovibrio magneticus]|uniref:Winged helix-turn-helix domain-containing protein n=1 Tax=Solidesulfovibrio magneticus (strain ATCC 700980 / DSM 13731 / RS-1) TaxID=573370 RepID=C4XKK2_SOLM1|nr:helix-turn-helix domain-containing protein [Solidesulfovibrio magneticus]BAH76942.1 hypothetical protein DMR_34510 [Solidesulfovibrio magneticus RS-1]
MSQEVYLANPIAPGAEQTLETLFLLETFGALTTAELQKFGIAAPQARVHDLRHKHGFLERIKTEMVMVPHHDGKIHRLGRYVLVAATDGLGGAA